MCLNHVVRLTTGREPSLKPSPTNLIMAATSFQESTVVKVAPRLGHEVSRTKDVPWYQSKVGSSLTPAGRQLLETYGGIPASEVEEHIYKIASHPSTSLTIITSSAQPNSLHSVMQHGRYSPGPA